MKALKGVCLLIVTLAVLAVPAVQAHSQGIISPTTARDYSAPPFPPPHLY